MDSQGALELLTARFSHPMVKKYAIYQLEQADNEVDHAIYNFSIFQIYLLLFLRNYCCIYYNWCRHYVMTLRMLAQERALMTIFPCLASLLMNHLVTQVTDGGRGRGRSIK